jgi:hypothetical protein
MSEYENHVEAGKEIILGTLSNLAIELSDPRVADLVFTTTNQDFDFYRVSLIDKHGNTIAKVEESDLADCPADSNVRAKLEGQLRCAIEVMRHRNIVPTEETKNSQ